MTAYVIETLEVTIGFKTALSAMILLSLLLSLWVVWLEHVLRQSRQSTAILSEALQKIAKGRARVRCIGDQVQVYDLRQ